VNGTLSGGGGGETLSILAWGDAQGPNEGGAHLLLDGEAAVFGNGFDAVRRLL
jgi:hypothetical protein